MDHDYDGLMQRPNIDGVFMTDWSSMNDSNGIIPPANLSLFEDNHPTLVLNIDIKYQDIKIYILCIVPNWSNLWQQIKDPPSTPQFQVDEIIVNLIICPVCAKSSRGIRDIHQWHRCLAATQVPFLIRYSQDIHWAIIMRYSFTRHFHETLKFDIHQYKFHFSE